MTGVEQRTSGIKSEHSTYCATTTSHDQHIYFFDQIREHSPYGGVSLNGWPSVWLVWIKLVFSGQIQTSQTVGQHLQWYIIPILK